MTVIGCEYLIGNALFYLTEERFIRLSALHTYRNQIQHYWNSNSINAIIVGEIEHAVYEFSDYFEKNNEADIIILNSDITKEMLQQRFVQYLPTNIFSSFKEVAENFS